MTNYHNTILFTGGGTLGPVTPLLAVLQELKRMNADERRRYADVRRQGNDQLFVWVGTKDGPEKRKINSAFPRESALSQHQSAVLYETLPVAKFDRFLSFRILIAPFVFLLALFKSLVILLKYHPRIIIGAGSFTQVPLMWAGWVLRIPSLIHQQDVRVGLANKLCAWCAKVITVNFDVSPKDFPSKKVKVVGNPVFIPSLRHPELDSGSRNENKQEQTVIASRAERGAAISGDATNEIASSDALLAMTEGDKPLLVVIGGGTGAEQLNRLVFLTAGELTKTFNIVLISGARDFGRGGVYLRPQGADARSAPTEGLHIIPFVDDSYHLLEKADLVVTRAGMGTLTELASLGKPTIIVPIPHSHQVENARYYKDHGAAELMEIDYSETESKADEFVAKLREVWDNDVKKESLTNSIKKLYNVDATKQMTDQVVLLI